MKISEGSKFIFIITSSGYLEDRFVYDVNFGINILKGRGLADEDIIIVTDTAKEVLVAKCGNLADIAFSTSSSLDFVIENAICENLFVISCCHGSMSGIDATPAIKPQFINQALKNNHHAKNILLFLGQCYAGIFNFMDVRDDNKRIVYIGATDIDTSLSYRLDGCGWVANISVFALFKWLESPVDIDGDGACSITDLYKYVAYYTNNVTRQIEKFHHFHLIDESIRIKMDQGKTAHDGSLSSEISKDAIELIRNFIIPHQNIWMLNAIAAGNMCIE